jgi:alkanesulfonate monooxygenase SsuD/methylene tetrahydromethanopterin reductase-like flavin-dependent oxidoreductase (luciferase family)
MTGSHPPARVRAYRRTIALTAENALRDGPSIAAAVDVQAALARRALPMIPKRTAAQADYARVVRLGGSPEQVADAKALYTAARLKEQILAAFDKSPIDPDDAAELATLILAGGAS